MKNFNFILILIFNLYPCSVTSQVSNNPSKIHLQNLSEYRSQLLLFDQAELEEFRIVIDKLSLNNFENEAFTEMLYQIIIDKKIYHYVNKMILHYLKKDFPTIKFKEELNENDIETISKNSELLESILDGVMKPKYPFSLGVNTSFFDEFYFYNIDSTDIVGEIGVGLGNFSLMMSILEPKVKLFVNEITRKKIQYLERKFKDESRSGKKVKVVLGSKRSANFPLNRFDKIIIRNSYHHFSNKKSMLNSIKESLKEDGILLLNEPTIELIISDDPCKKTLPKDKVVSKIIENGFILEETKVIGERLLMRFTIKK